MSSVKPGAGTAAAPVANVKTVMTTPASPTISLVRGMHMRPPFLPQSEDSAYITVTAAATESDLLAGLARQGSIMAAHHASTCLHEARCHERQVEVPGHRPVGARSRDREVLPVEEVLAAIGLPPAELRERMLVERARGIQVRHADRDVVEDVGRDR
jgi:hypothetical protein